MIVDSSKTGLANLINAINAANNTALLSDTNASFGLPQVLGTPVGFRDTSVTVTPVDNVDFVGSPVTFYYRRVSLDQNVVSPDLSYEVNDSTTLASLKAVVCTSLNLIASEVEWVETALVRDPADQGGTGFVTQIHLRPLTDSYVYDGDPLTINCEWAPTDQDIGTTFANTSLDSFDPVV
jgi:hypothetical protein